MWKPHDLPNRTRRLVFSVLLVSCVLSAAVVAIDGHDRADLDVEVRVEATGGDDGHVRPAIDGQVAWVQLRLQNNEPTAIEPVFATWTQSRKTQLSWDVVDGPERLEPGESAVITLEAPSDEAAIETNVPAQITVKTPDGTQRQTVHFQVDGPEQIPLSWRVR